MKKIILSIFVILMTVSLFSQPHQNRPEVPQQQGNQHRGNIFQLMRSLELTEQQQDEIKSIFEYHKEKNKTLIENMQTLREEIKDMIVNVSSSSEIKSLIRQMTELQGEIAVDRVDLAFEIRNVFTYEQLEKLPPDFLLRIIEPMQRRPQRQEPQNPHMERPDNRERPPIQNNW